MHAAACFETAFPHSMITFAWDSSKHMDPMQATAVYNCRPLPHIPTPDRTKLKSNQHLISTFDKLNTTTRTPRLPSIILNRSAHRSPLPPKPNPKRTKTVPSPRQGISTSLHSTSNHLLSGSASLVRSSPTLSIPTSLDRQKNALLQRRWPAISLLRSRRKLWKRYWLVINLPTVPESDESVHELESVQWLRLRSEKLLPRKPPSFDLSSTPIMRPASRCPPPASIEIPASPPPELEDDTGSESSSSSDEDLDAYEFDLSCCASPYLDESEDVPTYPTGIYDKPKDSRMTHLETDISAIYESITRRTQARISS